MFSFNVTGNGIRPLNTNWWRPTQREWAPLLTQDQRLPWRQESDPTTGRPWQSLTPKYAAIKARRYPGAPILRATGRMQDTSFIRPWRDGFEVVTTEYGPYHQFGTSKMVARPWMGIPDTSLERLPPISWKHILQNNTP